MPCRKRETDLRKKTVLSKKGWPLEENRAFKKGLAFGRKTDMEESLLRERKPTAKRRWKP